MNPRVISIYNTMAGCGKSAGLVSILENALDARKSKKVFLSFHHEALIDGQHRLLAIRDTLDAFDVGPSSKEVIDRDLISAFIADNPYGQGSRLY